MRKKLLVALGAALLAAQSSEAQQAALGYPGQLPPAPLPVVAASQQPGLEPLPAPQGQPAPFVQPPRYEPLPAPQGQGQPAPGPFVQPYPPPTPAVPTGGPVDPNFAPLAPHRVILEDGDRHQFWADVDFLLWWVKSGPSPNPLITTGSPNDAVPGALGQPNTTVLFGGSNINYGSFGGARASMGFWLPQAPVLGFEAGFFALQQRTVNFSALSDGNGDQIIARPVINAQTGTENSYIDSYPGVAAGGATVSSSTRLDSWELNMALNLVHTRHLDWDIIVGFRALDLVEDLQIQDVLVPLVAGNFTFLGGPADPPNTLADFDNFSTSNHFYGGQIGTRLNWNSGLFSMTWNAKVALGATQQVVNIDGGSALQTQGFAPATAPGGILAQPTNIGRYYHSGFSVVPETGLNLGYQLTPWCRLQCGYTFLYWTDVVRPGEQIDRTVNPSQVPTDPTYGTLTGPARPTFTPQTTDFWRRESILAWSFGFNLT